MKTRIHFLSLLLAALLPHFALAQGAPEPTFTFSADNVPLRQALSLFARANQLNIVADHDVDGVVTVDFRELPLAVAMNALLEANGCYFVKDGPLLRIKKTETRLFHIDYIQVTRAGQGANAVQISSGTSGQSGSTSGGTSVVTMFRA